MVLFSLTCTGQSTPVDSLLTITSSSAPDREKVQAYIALCKSLSTKNFDQTIDYANKGLAVARRSGDSLSVALLKRYAGTAEYFKGNYDQAASIYFEIISLLEKQNEQQQLAYVLNELAKLYRKTRDLDKALHYYDRALEIFQKQQDSAGIQMIYNESGVVFEYRGDYEEAIRRYKQSLAIAESLKDRIGIGYALNFIAGVYTIQKKFDDAETYLLKAMDIRKNLGDSFAVALTYTDLGVLYSAEGEYNKAIESLKASNSLAGSLKYPELQLNNYRELSEAARSGGDVTSALDYYKKHVALKDSLFSIEKAKQIAELSTRYESDKKEQQILLQKTRLSKKNLQIAGIVGLLLLSSWLAYSYHHRNRLKQESRLQAAILRQQELSAKAVLEAEENERQRIARDLHDGVGQMMSAAKMNLSYFEAEIPFKSYEQRLKFEKIINLVDESCREVRSVSHNMMPSALLKTGLYRAVREFIDRIQLPAMTINFHGEGVDQRLDTNVETVLYRVIQECVNNVTRHAKATQLDISLIKDNEGISVTIEDNGQGFEISRVESAEGLGIRNIRSRIAYLKGSVDFDSRPGKGTLVAIHIPQ